MNRRPPTAPVRPGSAPQIAARFVLAALLIGAGVSHLTWGRRGYRIVVPEWATRMLRLDVDAIVVASGAAEMLLGGALLTLPRERQRLGGLIAAFFVAVFPGNVHHWRTGRSVPGLSTDTARFARLFLQPVLVAWALWCTAAPRSAR
ncbi:MULTISPECIES: hypothetical protein [unclassified Microbacterium]|uniref:DoxX family protein n=1 Tax=unclassified Microbacterium TaxID=2609290 RepID=UPI0037451F8C